MEMAIVTPDIAAVSKCRRHRGVLFLEASFGIASFLKLLMEAFNPTRTSPPPRCRSWQSPFWTKLNPKVTPPLRLQNGRLRAPPASRSHRDPPVSHAPCHPPHRHRQDLFAPKPKALNPSSSPGISKTLVTASTSSDDTTWLSSIPASLNYTLAHYVVDRPLSPALFVPKPRGTGTANEAIMTGPCCSQQSPEI